MAERSLRRTLLLWLVLPLLVLLLGGTAAVYQLALDYAEHAYDRALYESAYDIANLAQQVAQSANTLRLPRMARDIVLSDQFDKNFFSISDENGKTLNGDAQLLPPLRDYPDKTGSKAIYYDTVIRDTEVRAVSIPLFLSLNGVPRSLRVQVAETTHKREALADEILSGFVVPQIAFILIAIGLVWLGVWVALRPLGRVEAAIAARSHRDLSPVPTADVPREVRPIIVALNDLLARLSAALASQKRFTADAAHQLRTPLAGLGAQVELAMAEPNPPLTQHALLQISKVRQRLSHLVSQLLTLARSEQAAIQPAQLIPLDLASMAREVTADFAQAAVQKQVDLGFEAPEGKQVTILGEPATLREMISNLVDNAIRYVGEGGTVTVHIGQDGALTVEDNGPGVPEGEKERIFERFHRLQDDTEEGSGLGLAIVQEIATRHNATVELADRPGGGSLFRIRLALFHEEAAS